MSNFTIEYTLYKKTHALPVQGQISIPKGEHTLDALDALRKAATIMAEDPELETAEWTDIALRVS